MGNSHTHCGKSFHQEKDAESGREITTSLLVDGNIKEALDL